MWTCSYLVWQNQSRELRLMEVITCSRSLVSVRNGLNPRSSAPSPMLFLVSLFCLEWCCYHPAQTWSWELSWTTLEATCISLFSPSSEIRGRYCSLWPRTCYYSSSGTNNQRITSLSPAKRARVFSRFLFLASFSFIFTHCQFVLVKKERWKESTEHEEGSADVG